MPVKRLLRTSSRTLSVAMRRLADHVTTSVHRHREAGRDQDGGVVLLDDERTRQRRLRRQRLAVEDARRDRGAVEEHAPLARRRARDRRARTRSGHRGLAGDAEGGGAQVQVLEVGRLVGVAVDLTIARMEVSAQRLAVRILQDGLARRYRQLEGLAEVAEVEAPD